MSDLPQLVCLGDNLQGNIPKVKIHHLNCGTLLPRFPKMKALVYCLLIETENGLVLVDSGFGTQDYTNPTPLMRFFLSLMGVPRDMEETAIAQVKRLGMEAADVRHIIYTHLHIDHAGGMRDFPNAQVHVYEREYAVAMRPRGIVERGYDRSHWQHNPKWRLYEHVDGDWYGFPARQILEGAGIEIWLISLPGHTSGHCGVAIATGKGWLLHCGDATSPFHRSVDIVDRPPAQQPLNLLPGFITRRVIGGQVSGLRRLMDRPEQDITIISSHDIYSFDRYKG